MGGFEYTGMIILILVALEKHIMVAHISGVEVVLTLLI
jgi:hypothetical protein